MALGIYSETSPGVYVAYSMNGAKSNPITTIHNGRNGEIVEKKCFVKSDNAHTYTNIQVLPMSTSSDDDIGLGMNRGTTGWGVKVLVDTNRNPTENDWDAVEYGTAINIADILSSTATRPFWIRIESPSGELVKNKENITLALLYTDSGS